MKTPKPTKRTEAEICCFECDQGTLRPTLRDYATPLKDGKKITIPDVPMLECDHCGDSVINDEGNSRIDTFLDHLLNPISPEEVQQLLSKYHLTQKEASVITGYGEKNFSRWATGKARPSESVSNILRLLLSDEQAFDRLRNKNFNPQVKPSFPSEERQPDAEETEVLKSIDYSKLVSLELVEETLSPLKRRTNICQLTRSNDLSVFGNQMSNRFDSMAAFKDTTQKFNPISAGLWSYIGEQKAATITTAPYDTQKLHAAVVQLRELTQHPLEEVATQARDILADAGVALVFVPIMKGSALRGCTRLLTPTKALIIHGLKFRSLSQFWIILFHEIAHLLLHIQSSKDIFTDYQKQEQNQLEQDADAWAYDTLASLDLELEFKAKHPKPTIGQLKQYAQSIKIHPAIAAEIFNKRAGKEVISYSYLKSENLFPQLTETEFKALI